MKWTRGSQMKMHLNAPGAPEAKVEQDVRASRPPPGGEQKKRRCERARLASTVDDQKQSRGDEHNGELTTDYLPGRMSGQSQQQQQQQQVQVREEEDEVELGQADYSTDSPPGGQHDGGMVVTSHSMSLVDQSQICL